MPNQRSEPYATEPLFYVADPPEVVTADAEKLSADRRRTIRQRESIAAGIHPMTGRRLRDGDDTCGSCAHAFKSGWGYWKCDRMPLAHSAANDLRKWWPACT